MKFWLPQEITYLGPYLPYLSSRLWHWSLSHWNSPFGFHGAILVFLLKSWPHLLGVLPLQFLEYWYSLEFFSNPSIYYFLKMVSPTLLLQITLLHWQLTYLFHDPGLIWASYSFIHSLVGHHHLDDPKVSNTPKSQRHHFSTSSPNPLPLIAPSACRGLHKIGLSLNPDKTLDWFLKLCATVSSSTKLK